jgi:hypothetical protein
MAADKSNSTLGFTFFTPFLSYVVTNSAIEEAVRSLHYRRKIIAVVSIIYICTHNSILRTEREIMNWNSLHYCT